MLYLVVTPVPMALDTRILFEQFVNNNPSLSWIINTAGVYRYANQALYDFIGTSNITGRTVMDLFPPHYATGYLTALLRVAAEQKPYEQIFEGADAEGNKRHFLAYIFPIIGTEEKLIGGWAIDVSELLAAEDTIRLHSHIMDNVELAIFATDMEGRIFYWNKHAGMMYHCSAEEAIGQKAIDVIHSPGGQFAELVKTNISGQAFSGEFDVALRDGSSFPVYISGAPVKYSTTVQSGVIVISRDVSERMNARKKMEVYLQTVENQNKKLREIAFQQSHVVRRPLANILGLIPLLWEKITDEEGRSVLTLLQDSAEELDDVIKTTVQQAKDDVAEVIGSGPVE
jgi:PAS domain S-box-containing protein